MLTNAFNMALKLTARTMTLTRPGVVGTYTVKVSASNYSRNLQGPEEMVISGAEFVISIFNLTESGFTGKLKRGDWLTDSELGKMAITEVDEMIALGGTIIGYRVRVG